MADIERGTLESLADRLAEIEGYLHVDKSRERVAELEKVSSEPGFWDDADRARTVMAELASAKADVAGIDETHDKLEEALTAFDLGSETSDEDLLDEAAQLASSLESDLSDLELSSWFTDDLDHGDAIVTVTPGQGGLEAQDWCDMLFHMYLRYCDRRGWKVAVNDAPQAEVIGIDRATFTVSGKNAYGMLRAEQGVHRLVRISPTDDKKRRQTTFAGVEVLPVTEETDHIDIPEGELRIDVFRSSGPGGQSVNTTDSAVRITHLPTGIVVSCQNEKSQLQNKAAALRVLQARLLEKARQDREKEMNALKGDGGNSWGAQMRSYVMNPYQMVKDLRTEHEVGNPEAVFQGDIDGFIDAGIRWRKKSESAA